VSPSQNSDFEGFERGSLKTGGFPAVAQECSQILGLKSLFDEGRIAPAYLFYGQSEAKVLPLVYDLAAYVLSSANPIGDPGHWLERTKKFISQNTHPNFFFLTNSGSKEITVDSARAMSSFLRSTPTIPGWRFVIISPAAHLNNAASNALLKVLEEPPKKVVVALVSYGLLNIKPTILSRVQKIFFRVDKETTQKYLQDQESAEFARKVIEVVAKILKQREESWGQANVRGDALGVGAFDPIKKALVDEIALNGDLLTIFSKVILTFLYEQIHAQIAKRSTIIWDYARVYESVVDFISVAENKSLSIAHFVNAVFSLLSIRSQKVCGFT
jgi:hypothetical protein